jgi:hypothetical protein
MEEKQKRQEEVVRARVRCVRGRKRNGSTNDDNKKETVGSE